MAHFYFCNLARPSNLDSCLRVLENPCGDRSLEYVCATLLINSQWYGLPQNRNRLFILGVKVSYEASFPPADRVVAEAVEHMKKMHLKTAPVASCRRLIIFMLMGMVHSECDFDKYATS